MQPELSAEWFAASPEGRNIATLLVAASPGPCVNEAVSPTPGSPESTLAATDA
jgi:hypothetical protein